MDSKCFWYLVLVPFGAVLIICLLFYNVSAIQNSITGPLVVLIFLYGIHMFLLYSKANGCADEYINKDKDVGNVERIRRERVSRYTLLDCVSHHDGGWISIWAYTAISFLLPVFLSAAVGFPQLPDDAVVVRRVCVASMIVLIALELSHIHMLRENAARWFPTMLASLALDIAILVVVGWFADGSAQIGGGPQVSGNTQIGGNVQISGDVRISGDVQISGNGRISGNAQIGGGDQITDLAKILIVMVNVVAVIVSLNALLFARVAGALYDDKVDVPPPSPPNFVGSASGNRR